MTNNSTIWISMGGYFMNFRFVSLQIERIIIHQIFQRGEERTVIPPVYNDELIELDIEGLNLLQERIIDAMGSNSHSIEMEISNVSKDSIFKFFCTMLEDTNTNFIEHSKRVAYKLAESQSSRRIPGGIVVIFKGTVGSPAKRFIAVIKAEIHDGFALDHADDSLNLLFIRNLLLTPQQKLYKIGMFIETSERDTKVSERRLEEFRVFVYDHNMTGMETRSAAIYFYESFLGCSIMANNKKLTRDFYFNTRDFINQMNITDEAKVDLNSALYSYLKLSRSNVIQTSSFAEEYLDTSTRDAYSNYMRAKGFPDNAIPKDIDLIRHKLRQQRVKFSSGVKLSAPSENFSDLVQIQKSENNRTYLSILGSIEDQN